MYNSCWSLSLSCQNSNTLFQLPFQKVPHYLVCFGTAITKTNNHGWYSLFSLFQYSTNISYQSRLSKLVMIISSSTCTPYDTDTFPFYLCHTILFSFKLICFSISFPSFSTYSFFLFLFFTLHFWISFHITYFTLSPLYLYISCTNVLQIQVILPPQLQFQV